MIMIKNNNGNNRDLEQKTRNEIKNIAKIQTKFFFKRREI